jgi:hypothetical protein
MPASRFLVPQVAGSNPAAPTSKINDLEEIPDAKSSQKSELRRAWEDNMAQVSSSPSHGIRDSWARSSGTFSDYQTFIAAGLTDGRTASCLDLARRKGWAP